MKSIMWAVAVAILLVTGAASAQPVDPATRAAARTLVEDGWKLYDAGDFAGALPKFSQARQLVPASTVYLYEGKSLEKLGRLVEASEAYLLASRAEVESGAPKSQSEAKVEAAAAREALLPKIPSVEIVVEPAGTEGAILLDGLPLRAAALGLRRPIDPGAHTVVLRQGGVVVASRSWTAQVASFDRIVVTIGAQPPGLAPKASPTDPPPAVGPHDPPSTRIPVAPTPASASPAPWIVGGVGVASLIAGGIAGGIVLGYKADADAGCSDITRTCTRDGKAAADAGRQLGPVSTVLLVAGGVGVAAGGVWLGVRSKSSRVAASVSPTAGGAFLRVGASW